MAIERLPEFPGDEEALQAIERGQSRFIKVYDYQKIEVVLGRSTRLHPDINVEACQKEGVPILRRKGGGGAVVLSPGVWVITACYKNSKKNLDIPLVLEKIALEIAKGIEEATKLEIRLRGMSDLCIGDRKILGSSLYNGRGAILYQGSLLVNNDLKLISKLLNHPSKEPAYRQGRSHEEFVTNIFQMTKVDTKLLKQCILQRLQVFSP